MEMNVQTEKKKIGFSEQAVQHAVIYMVLI